MLTWIDCHQTLTLTLAALSVGSFVGSILCLPLLIAAIPPDYFIDQRRHASRLHQLHPLVFVLLLAAKNLLGWTLVFAGLLMLVLPGQGLLTILTGLILSDFPGKFRLERRLAANHKLLNALNWIRRRVGRLPLQPPETPHHPRGMRPGGP